MNPQLELTRRQLFVTLIHGYGMLAESSCMCKGKALSCQLALNYCVSQCTCKHSSHPSFDDAGKAAKAASLYARACAMLYKGCARGGAKPSLGKKHLVPLFTQCPQI